MVLCPLLTSIGGSWRWKAFQTSLDISAMARRRGRQQRRGHHSSQGLSYVMASGGRTRRHRYLYELRAMIWPVIFAVISQAVIYIGVTMRTGRTDWVNVLAATAVITLVPIFAAGIFVAIRRQEAKIITAAIVTLGLFSVATSIIAAFRLPVSYQGLAATVPITVLSMAYANVMFIRTLFAHVALAAIPQADEIAKEVGGIRVLSDPTADLGSVEIVLIDPRVHHNEQWSALLAKCYLSGIEIMPWTRYIELMRGRLDVSTFEVSHLAYTPTQQLYARAKVGLDILVVLLTAPITLPLAALVAIYVAARDGGPVIFVQLRRGYAGRPFRMYKFRTMYQGLTGGATAVGDSRIIPGCGIVRKLRLDELPQLYNILRGEMSLIGPRPEALDLDRYYARVIPKYPMRQLVLPGISGWAQVNSGYTSNPDEALTKLSYDLYYIKHMSLDLDLQVMFRTIRTILFASGAR